MVYSDDDSGWFSSVFTHLAIRSFDGPLQSCSLLITPLLLNWDRSPDVIFFSLPTLDSIDETADGDDETVLVDRKELRNSIKISGMHKYLSLIFSCVANQSPLSIARCQARG